MKIALYQGPGIPLDVDANIQVLDAQAASAAAQSARLLIAPEMILSGYNIGASAIAERAEASDGPSARVGKSLRLRHRRGLRRTGAGLR